jgi:hypothetical protein
VAQLPEINWQQIRGKAPSGSRYDGFEELGNQLMIYGGLVNWPDGTTFTTFGNPTGGREGRGELPGGATRGWQTKYLFKLDQAEFAQIDKSVRRVLETEPNLERYYVIRDADPADKAKIYSGVGLRLTYQPARNAVIAEARPSAIMYEGSCPRGT